MAKVTHLCPKDTEYFKMSAVKKSEKKSQKDLIAESWKRSKKYGIDPKALAAPSETKLTPGQLKARIRQNPVFFNVVNSRIKALYEIIEGTGFSIAVSDSDGYILHVLGDEELVEVFKKRNCMPGYRWTEKDVGTCAIGLALREKVPVQVSGDEMYAESAKTITNSAVPIFDSEKKLLGVIALSGFITKVHLHTLGMLTLAAKTIQAQMVEIEKSQKLDLQNKYMISLLESDHRGVIALDKSAKVIQLNSKARKLLGFSQSSPLKQIQELFYNFPHITEPVKKCEAFEEKEITYTLKKGKTIMVTSLDPIVMPSGENGGALLVVVEKKRIMNLVNKMAGSQAHFTFKSIVGNSQAVQNSLNLAKIAAGGKASVLLCGETGTGKELFAQAIHNAGKRGHNPFVVINCGAIPKELLESELFGYVEGSFTGAKKGGRPGKFELADGGTLFLDEIGDMPMDMQVKILRALESGEIQRVGGTTATLVDLRIIAATNVNLERAIKERNFRQDLFYRISTIKIEIPPLREREDDVIELANYFLKRKQSHMGKELSFPKRTLMRLKTYHWPGNIRQLENAVERSVNVASKSAISSDDLGIPVADSLSNTHSYVHQEKPLKKFEKEILSELMREHAGNISKVAKVMGISRPTLYRKLKQYNIQ